MKKGVMDELIELSEAEHKFMDSSKSYARNHKPLIITLSIIIIVVTLFSVIKVPTKVERSTIEQSPLVIPKVETREMEFLSLEPYYEEQLKEVTIDNREEAYVKVEDCRPQDFDFNYRYLGDLSENDFDSLNDVGYDDGWYHQAVEFCNEEDEKLQLSFDLCLWYGEELEACKGEYPFEVMANSCKLYTGLTWETDFDSEKDLFVEFRSVSQKEVCGEGQRKILVGKRPHTEYIRVNVTRYRPVTEMRTVLIDTNDVVYRDVSKIKEDVVFVNLWTYLFGWIWR